MDSNCDYRLSVIVGYLVRTWTLPHLLAIRALRVNTVNHLYSQHFFNNWFVVPVVYVYVKTCYLVKLRLWSFLKQHMFLCLQKQLTMMNHCMCAVKLQIDIVRKKN